MLDRAQRIRADGKADVLLQRVALQGHIAEIGQEAALSSALGMAHIVPGKHRFPSQLATTGHGLNPSPKAAESRRALTVSRKAWPRRARYTGIRRRVKAAAQPWRLNLRIDEICE